MQLPSGSTEIRGGRKDGGWKRKRINVNGGFDYNCNHRRNIFDDIEI